MENTKYIPLENDKFPWVGAHCSCLLDELFREKYTIDGKDRKMKREREVQERRAKEATALESK